MPIASFRRPLRRLAAGLLGPLLGRGEVGRLIRRTAREQWKLLTLSVAGDLVQAVGEGATFGVIFLAVDLLTTVGEARRVNWASKPLIGAIPGATEWLAAQPLVPLFLVLLALAVLLQAIQSGSRWLSGVCAGYFAARCRARVMALVHGRILRFSFACASGYPVGELVDHAAQAPEGVRRQLEAVQQLLVSLLMIAVYLGVLVGLSPLLLLAALALGLLLTLLQQRLVPRIWKEAVRLSGIQAAIASRITEDIQGLRLLHVSGERLAADRAVRGRMGELEGSLRRQARLGNLVGPISSFLPVAAIGVMAALSLLVFGARSSGVLPGLITFVLALQRLNMRFSGLAGIVNEVAENGGRMERLNALLDPVDKTFVREGGLPFTALRHGIRLEGVELLHSSATRPALAGIDLAIPKGTTVALVGASGAGKSSIADLLTGLYEPTAGRILVDGVDLRELDLLSWQQRIGVVSQDTFLFNASLAENVGFGAAAVTPERLRRAAALAQALEFIEELPQGWNTVVGERGFRLSGGQRQRVALARALLREPELLILDEATSALDSRSERRVQEAIEGLAHSHTVLVIAHRLSTIVAADVIAVLEAGRIVERGRHEELLERGGPYADLWARQAGSSGREVLEVGPGGAW